MKLRFAVFGVCLGLVGCGAKVPDEYAALGVPPNPDRVASISKQENPDNTVYTITYRVPFDPAEYVATNDKIIAAGYEPNERGDSFSGPKGKFGFFCAGNECRLQTYD